MPIYEYQCESCSHRFEVIQKLSDPVKGKCEECGGVAKRQISAPAFQFKGTGWYVTDYAGRKSSDAPGGDSESKSGDSESKSGDSESKPKKKKDSGSSKAKSKVKSTTSDSSD